MRTYVGVGLFVALAVWGNGCSDADDGGVGGMGGEGSACRSADNCEENLICRFADGVCGADEPGTCVRIGGCSTGSGPFPQVCACDGSFIGTDCIGAEGNGISHDMSACGGPPTGQFACRGRSCPIGDAYCEMPAGRCMTFSDTCTSCDCFTVPCSGGTCSEASGGLVITCP